MPKGGAAVELHGDDRSRTPRVGKGLVEIIYKTFAILPVCLEPKDIEYKNKHH